MNHFANCILISFFEIRSFYAAAACLTCSLSASIFSASASTQKKDSKDVTKRDFIPPRERILPVRNVLIVADV